MSEGINEKNRKRREEREKEDEDWSVERESTVDRNGG